MSESTTNEGGSDDSDVLQDLKGKLKQLYREFNIPRIHWMHKGCDLPLGKYYADLEIDSSKKKIKLEEIFATETSKTKAMKRIFIEGKSGFGKTTLTSKLAYDWATTKKLSYMQNFELVFILELKRIQNVKSALDDAAKLSGFEKLEILDSLISKLGNKVLIILDGYDEVSTDDVRESIHKVLYKENYNEAIVAITCRNGMFDSNSKILTQYCNLLRRRIEFWDRKINVCGLDDMGQKKMLEDFLTTKKSKDVFEKLQHLTEPMSDILKSPLILMLLGFLYANVIEIEFDMKSTNLFKDIINGIVSYNVRKKDELINENIDLFDNRQEAITVDFFEFGRICLESLKTSKIEFEYSDLMEEIYRKGFLIKLEVKSNFGVKISFEPIHRSFLEFFAAYFVWTALQKSNEKEFEDSTIQSLNRIFFNTKGTTLVLKFLVGMLRSEAYILFQQLAANVHLYLKFEAGLWRILEDCEETERIIESLIPFIPIYIGSSIETTTSFTSSDFFEHLMQKGQEQSKLHAFIVVSNLDIKYKFPRNTHFKRIVVEVADEVLEEHINHLQSMLKEVSCSEVVFYFFEEMNSKTTAPLILIKLMNIFESLNLYRRMMIVKSSASELLTSCFKSETLQERTIHHLTCLLQSDGDWHKFVQFLLKSNQLEELSLIIQNNICWSNVQAILKNAAKSKLSVLILQNSVHFGKDDGIVYLMDFRGEVKKWESLRLDGVKVSDQAIRNNLLANELEIYEADENAVQTILNSKITSLECSSTFLTQLLDFSESSALPIFLSVRELIFVIEDEGSQPDFWQKLKSFQQIEKLSLQFSTEDLNSSDNISTFVQSTKVILLEIVVTKTTFDAAAKFLTHLGPSLLRKEHPLLRTVLIRLEDKLSNLSELIIPLLNCLENKILQEIEIAWSNDDDWRFESMDWVNTKKFRMDNAVCGTDIKDLKPFIRSYNVGSLFPKIRMTLTDHTSGNHPVRESVKPRYPHSAEPIMNLVVDGEEGEVTACSVENQDDTIVTDGNKTSNNFPRPNATATASASSCPPRLEKLPNGHYKIGPIEFYPECRLGVGSDMTQVFKGRYEVGAKAAVKRMELCPGDIAPGKKQIREAELHLIVNHKNVVRYFHWTQCEKYMYIAIERCIGTLADLLETDKLKDLKIPLDFNAKLQFMRDISEGLQYIHQSNIVHRDLKPSNVLISLNPATKKYTLKISDFGISKKIPAGQTSCTKTIGINGTIGWAPPEMEVLLQPEAKQPEAKVV